MHKAVHVLSFVSSTQDFHHGHSSVIVTVAMSASPTQAVKSLAANTSGQIIECEDKM